MHEPFYGWPYGNKVRRRWWSLVNWLKGYKFGPVQRHRCCDHTTPGHGWSCANHPGRGRCSLPAAHQGSCVPEQAEFGSKDGAT